MRICKIYAGEFPWDVRVDKIIGSLLEHGHEVTLLCRWSENRPQTERRRRLTIHRFPLRRYGKPNGPLGDIPAFLNSAWTRFIHDIMTEEKFDLVLVRDIPLTLNSVSVARRHQIPIVLDMAENYPAMFRDVLRFEQNKGINLVLKNPFVAKLIERRAIRSVDSILVVVEESMERLVRLGVPRDKMTLVSNTPAITLSREAERHSSLTDELSLMYVGGFERARGLEWIIRMLPVCVAEIPHLHFYLLGDSTERVRLEEMSARFGVKERTHFLGWVDASRVPLHIQKCDIGLIPHEVTEHTNSTVPNKLFDYMYAGKPVLASNARPIVRILREENCGVTFEPGRGNSFLEGLRALKGKDFRKELGENGKAAVLRKYNWAIDEERLLGELRDLVRVRSGFGRAATGG